MKKSFPEDIVIWNVYFESGNYIDTLKIYESLQIDIIVITSVGVFCVEAKWLNDNNCVRLTGGALSKSWTLNTKKGTTNSEVNGLKQNYRHYKFLVELFEKEHIDCPIYQITVIGGLSRNKMKYVDKEAIVEIIKDWRCATQGIDILHMVYVRNIATKKLPIKCKKEMRNLDSRN